MFSEGALKIELRRGSKLSVLEVQYDRALIGSGAHCDVRLAPDEAAVEQLLVELVGEDEVYARTKTVKPPVLLNGAPFLEGRLLPTSLLELGGVALRVERVAKQDGETPARRPSGSTSPLAQGLGLLLVVAGLFVVLSKPSPTTSALTRAVQPPPAAGLAAQSCPSSQPLAAAAQADQLRADAESKRERAPFYPGDALDATPLFERAARCYELAGDTARAREAHDAALRLHDQVADDLHVRHVRLERYLAQNQYDDARRQAQLLAELVPEKSGAYAAWLSAVRREAELRNDSEKGKRR